MGGHNEDGGSRFGQYVVNLPAKHAPIAASRILEQYQSEKQGDEALHEWYERIGGKKALADRLDDLRAIPPKADDPSYYADWGDAQPFEVILGTGECMA